ncbi:MAG: lipase maturation factor family protein [Longimicrobiaceae bacterium]
MRFGALVPDAPEPPPGYLWPRWIFLRALGAIFFSAFYSFAFQLQGLIGPRGILPAGEYLRQLADVLGPVERAWYAPTLLWLGAGDAALTAVVVAGIIASLLLVANVWPRAAVAACTLLFLSCVAALQDFSSYQSDGMLLEAGFISLFFAPRGIRPGLGAADPPSWLSLFMLRWEWFRIYFESGVVKLASGDPHWRDLTAMDEYYQNGPLPTWIGWYVQHFPHGYHAATVVFTLGVELVLVWAVFLPRRFRIACCAVVTALQIGIIATANYAFLNYLVLVLGVLLLDDRLLARLRFPLPDAAPDPPRARPAWRRRVEAGALGLALYVTVAAFLMRLVGGLGPLGAPVRLLAPFRIANAYGLFAVMTPARYEIEFQGSRDGRTWVAYPFRNKPQDPREAPGIYAPYQPRFEWNLWFASLGPWEESRWVVLAQQRLVEGSPEVLRLFRRDPFQGRPPAMVRTVVWQYWFTDLDTKRRTGLWWRRRDLGPFTGTLARSADGRWILDNPPMRLAPLEVTAPPGE